MGPEPMTERFEMRLGLATLEKLDAWRARQDDLPSRAEAVRRLLEVGLDSATTDRQIKLDDGDKLGLLMLCDLFNHLKLKTDIDPKFVEKAILGGHLWALRWRYPGVFHGYEASTAVVDEVVNVLDMWSFLEDGFAKLSKKDKARVAAEAAPFGDPVRFSGFDGNNESEYCGVARFLVNELDRFAIFKGRDFDSHMPLIQAYRRMLAVFEPIRPKLAGRGLSATEIIDVLKAKLHPSR